MKNNEFSFPFQKHLTKNSSPSLLTSLLSFSPAKRQKYHHFPMNYKKKYHYPTLTQNLKPLKLITNKVEILIRLGLANKSQDRMARLTKMWLLSSRHPFDARETPSALGVSMLANIMKYSDPIIF